MSLARSSMLLLGLCMLAVLLGGVRLLTQPPELPDGSSLSPQPDGLEALYDWANAVQSPTSRLRPAGAAIDPVQPPRLLLVVQPAAPIQDDQRQLFDQVPAHGGSLVLAGDSPASVLYARALGVTLEPARRSSPAATPDGALRFPVAAGLRVQPPAGEILLRAANGDVLGVREPYLQGSLVVLSSAAPLTNAGLRDADDARFVYRTLLAPAQGGAVAFDELHHANPPEETSASPSLFELVLQSAPGRALVYAGVVIFVYLLLAGRRLGPPLLAPAPAQRWRSMAEHVQMVANLHRRAGHLASARAAFSRHYRRALARRRETPSAAAAIARIEAAASTTELIHAVAAADVLVGQP